MCQVLVYNYVLQVLWCGVVICLQPELNSTNENPVFRVSNGVPALPGEIPYQIAFKKPMLNQKNRHHPLYFTFCGGAIIGEYKLLSAAHCFFEPPSGELCSRPEKVGLQNKYAVAGTVRNVGHYKTDHTTEQWRKMYKVYTPKYYEFPDRDIAVVILEEYYVLNRYVNTIPYASKTIDYGSIQCLVSGFGKVSDQFHSENLMKAYLYLLPRRRCKKLHRKRMDKFICTDSDVADVLEGDSGGPLVCFNTGDPNERDSGVVVGVVSGKREFDRGGTGGGSFFTRVSSYDDFIKNRAGLYYSTTYFYILLFSYIRFLILFLFYLALMP